MMRAPIRRILSVALAAALAASTAGAAKREKETAPEPSGPELKLSATPKHGFRPLALTLMAHLRGVAAHDDNFCHPGVEWEWVTPSGLTETSREDPRCLHPPEQGKVELTYSRQSVIDRPGIYVHRLILHLKDGTTVRSNTQEIRVLDNQ